MSGDITMAQVVEALHEVYDDDGVAIVLSRGKVIGGKYPGMTPIEVCRTAEGRYDVWAMAQGMADGVFV